MSIPATAVTATAARAAERLAAAHARLAEAVESLATSQGWQRMLTVAARFHDYSPSNVLLITAQRPDATRVAGYRTWAGVGRQVRAGERGIAIIAPTVRGAGPDEASAAEHRDTARERLVTGFRVVHVFDVAQTDGAPLPEPDRPRLLHGQAPPGLWQALTRQLRQTGFSLIDGDCSPANGVTDHTTRTVTIHSGLPAAQRVKTLAHELGHVLLHDPASRPAGFDRARAEIEAESFAYLVTAAHGCPADAYSVPYLTGWARGDTTLLQSTAQRVLRTAGAVLAACPPSARQPADPDVRDRGERSRDAPERDRHRHRSRS
jgi:hypothetical protein